MTEKTVEEIVNEKKEQTLRAYKRVFESEDGMVILKDLMKSCYFFDTTYDLDGIEFREGQRMVIVQILKTLNLDLGIFIKETLEKQQGEYYGFEG